MVRRRVGSRSSRGSSGRSMSSRSYSGKTYKPKQKKFEKGFIGVLQRIQYTIDLTPILIRISNRVARSGKLNIGLFIFFILIGVFGLFVPIIQGWLTIVLAFTMLGIQPINSFVQDNTELIEGVGTFMFSIAAIFLLVNTATWATGITESSPVDNVFGFVQGGQDSINGVNEATFSIIGVDYEKDVQQPLSLVDYKKGQGLSVIGVNKGG